MLDADRLLALEIAPVVQTWSPRDTAIYALGIGFGRQAVADPAFLRFVLEERIDSFPTMATVPAAAWSAVLDPALGVRVDAVVHGEESVEFRAPMPAVGPFTGHNRVVAVWDRGPDKGAVVQVEKTLVAGEHGAVVAHCRSNLLLRGNGGFGGTGEGAPGAAPDPAPDPAVAPDGCFEEPTLPEQALIYRLSGDRNPLHSDPAPARAAGFARPIMHGLCTLGFAARGLVAALAGGDEKRLAKLSLRFSRPVFPGESLHTEYWDLGGGEFAFRSRMKAGGAVALAGGRMQLA